MKTHVPIVADDMGGVAPLTDPRCIGCCYIAFEDLVEGDSVVAACQGGTFPYVRKVRFYEKAQAVVAETMGVNSTAQLGEDLKIHRWKGWE